MRNCDYRRDRKKILQSQRSERSENLFTDAHQFFIGFDGGALVRTSAVTLTSLQPCRTLTVLYGRAERESAHGKNRVAVQAARVYLSVLRNLRRHQRLLGLRSAGRGTQAQRQGTLVEQHDPP